MKAASSETAGFAREWNAAFLLMAVFGGLLLAADQMAAGTVALGLCALAVLARWRTMRKVGLGFYGQTRRPRSRSGKRLGNAAG